MQIKREYLRPVLTCTFWLFISGLTLNAVRIHGPQLRAAVLPSNPIPYTAILQDYAVQADGTAVPTHRLTVAVRADGSRVIEVSSSVLDHPFSERILNFSSGKLQYVMEIQRRKSTTLDADRNKPGHWLQDARNNCVVPGAEPEFAVVGEEIVGGYRTVKVTAGQVTQWLALDYGCALIKDRAEWGDGQISEKRLVALISGEPSAVLFDDPGEFEEVPNSKLFPGPNSSTRDVYYYSHRPTK